MAAAVFDEVGAAEAKLVGGLVKDADNIRVGTGCAKRLQETFDDRKHLRKTATRWTRPHRSKQLETTRRRPACHEHIVKNTKVIFAGRKTCMVTLANASFLTEIARDFQVALSLPYCGSVLE